MVAVLFIQALPFVGFLHCASLLFSEPRLAKRPLSRREEFCGILKSWIKRALTAPLLGFEHLILGFKTHRKHTRWRRQHRKKSRVTYIKRQSHDSLRKPSRIVHRRRTSNATIFLALPAATTKPIRADKSSHPFDSDSYPLLLDNRASKCLTNVFADFVDTPRKTTAQIKGIGDTKVPATYKGTVRWSFEDDEGKVHEFFIPETYYSPSVPGRILSLQHWSQAANDNKPRPRGTYSATYDDCIELYWDQRKYKRTAPYDPASNVATIYSAPSFSLFDTFCAQVCDDEPVLNYLNAAAFVSDDEDSSDDEEGTEDRVQSTRELEPTTEREHSREEERSPFTQDEHEKVDFSLDGPRDLAIVEDEEINFSDLQHELMHWHYRLGHLSYKKLKQLAEMGDIPYRLRNARPFKCTACMFAKATKRPWRTKAPINQRSIPPVTQPGDCVSVDQLESKTPGFVGQLKSPILTKNRYKIATIFVDHFSRLSFVYLQYSSSGAETLKAKLAFEDFARSHGVTIKHYHADNGRFVDNLFKNSCEEKGQTQSFCGVNAHWQNGIAERHIRSHQETARTMLLHAKHRWPSAVETYLWPYALRMACEVHCYTPRFDGKIPMTLFSNVNVAPSKRHFHPFACPVYVLDNEMQQGKSYSKKKWTERSRVGLYLGPSPQHARSVHLVLNLETGFVSPQFHVSFDDHFETTRKGAADLLPRPKWKLQAHFEKEDEKTPVSRDGDRTKESSDETKVVTGQEGATEIFSASPQQNSNFSPQYDVSTTTPAASDTPTISLTAPTAQPTISVAPSDVTRTRSGRVVRPATRLIEVLDATLTDGESPEDFLLEEQHPLLFAFAASADPDTMYLHEAMRQPDREQFIRAMKKEVNDHTTNGNWMVVHRSEVPKGQQVLPAVWSMKRKRRIATREVYKWKARLTVHGGKQTKGINYWDTYAPLVQWSTTRLFLTMSVLRDWYCRQLDFVLAYTQADAECELYMEIPRGFTVEGNPKEYALRLLKNLYGLKQAGRVWNLHLTRQLLDLGFTQSEVDPCVFYRGNCVLLIYCDDTLMMGPSAEELDEVFALLDKTFTVSDEGTISDYLGIKVSKMFDGRLSFTQPQLIASIISDCGLDKPNAKPRKTPALSSRILRRDEDGESWLDQKWKY
jgi:hypothetical protein